jgi:hypothetical protein
MHNEVSLCLPGWATLYRLVPAHFPPINLFEEVADPEDLDIVFAIEAMTNDRIRDEAGELALVPRDQRISGPGSSPIMAAFTHIGKASRFTDGQYYGVYYAARELITAIKETVYHRELFLRQTHEPDTELTMRCYANKATLEMHDIRAEKYRHLHSEDYAPSQSFAAQMRKNGSNGLIYNSVRDPGGECLAAFKPSAVTIPVQAGHFKYQWHARANKIINVLSIKQVEL